MNQNQSKHKLAVRIIAIVLVILLCSGVVTGALWTILSSF